MRRVLLLPVLALLSASLLFGCSAADSKDGRDSPQAASPAAGSPRNVEERPRDTDEEGAVLVAFFSNTGNTRAVAELAARAVADAGKNVEFVEIKARIPYTAEDLNYNDESSRANREQGDPAARPGVNADVPDWDAYDTVMLGYPIWWGQAPKAMYSFVESYDSAGKVVVPFCTSGSSGIGTSAANLSEAGSGEAIWLEGRRFSGSATLEEVSAWIDGLDLP